MADAQDPYAAARAETRAAVKYYATSLVGIGSVLMAGLSFSILPDLSGSLLYLVIGFGVIAIGALVYGVLAIQKVVFPTAFDPARLEDSDLKALLAPYLPTLMPIDAPTPAALEAKLNRLKTAPQTNEVVADINRLVRERTKMHSFAAALDLDETATPVKRQLLVVFALVLCMAGGATLARGVATAQESNGIPISLSLTGGWTGYLSALAAACPMPYPDALTGTGQQGTPFDGWWTVTLTGAPCEGVILSVPARMVLSPE